MAVTLLLFRCLGLCLDILILGGVLICLGKQKDKVVELMVQPILPAQPPTQSTSARETIFAISPQVPHTEDVHLGPGPCCQE